MKRKITLDIYELERYRRDEWSLYASQSYKGTMLYFYVNYIEQYKVVYGDTVLYEGTDVAKANDAWNNV